MAAEDELELRRRRLRWRAWHRGTKEMDLVFGPFVDAAAAAMSEADLLRLEALMAEADSDLTLWVTGQVAPPPGIDNELLERILAFRATPSPPG